MTEPRRTLDTRRSVGDHNDDDQENSQPVRRGGGRRGHGGRPPGSSRGRYSEMRQQHRDDVSEKPRYSNVRVRVRGFGMDGGDQRRVYGSRNNDRHQDEVEYHAETKRGRGKQSAVDRQTVRDRSGQPQEDWNEEFGVGGSNKPTEQSRERYHGKGLQATDGKVSEMRPPIHDDQRVLGQQEDRRVSREPPARRVHPTRTISNRHYQAADNISSRDRGSQIGGIVDAMNKISVKTAATDYKRDVARQEHVSFSSATIVSGMHCTEITTSIL